MVRVVRLERTVSWSQTRRDTNFAIPGYSLSCHDTTANGKNKVFSVCGHSCGQSRFCAVFCNRGKSRKCRRRKALRRFLLPRPGYRHGTPKPPALPTALHPVIQFIYPPGCILPDHPPGSGRHGRRAEDMASHDDSPNIIHHPSAARKYFLIDVCARLCYSDTIQKVRRMTP